ncbi:MAG: DNA-processing protein DprA [Clostridia bacterium]|nr:DNA-processing protein DprA [Clostridia bacterium]
MLLSKENITLVNLITIQQCFGAGSIKAVKIFNCLRDADLLDKAFKESEIKGIIEVKDADKILKIDINKIYKIIDDCLKNNIYTVTICDSNYPERLRNISDCPIVLYIKGEFVDIDNMPLISVVGPRKISDFGKKAAFSLAKRLGRAGMIIVSGAALGADTCAHKGALAAKTKTIAVLGCGICYDYLPENRALRDEISKNGCLISEHPPYAPATKYSFPIRNRIISALSMGTVVIEASLKSGSLITARLANEQGRDVFVIPGNPTLDNYKGSNALLRDGAIPLLNAADIFNQYITAYPDKIDIEKAFAEETVKTEKISRKNLQSGLSNDAKIVYNNLNKLKFTADDLLDLNLSDEQLLSSLTELEIEGLVRALPGGMYEVINH